MGKKNKSIWDTRFTSDGIASDEWITMKGAHILLGDDGTVQAGAGGKFTGKKLSESLKYVWNKKGESEADFMARTDKMFAQSKIPDKQSRLVRPITIKKETEKAYAVDNPLYNRASQYIQNFGHPGKDPDKWVEMTVSIGRDAVDAYRQKQMYVWLPKSRTTADNGQIVGAESWLIGRNNLTVETEEQTSRREQAFKAHDDLVAQAQKMGIKGVHAKMKTSTLKKKIEDAQQGTTGTGKPKRRRFPVAW